VVKDVKAPGNIQLQRRRDTRRFRLRLLQKFVVEVAQNRHFLRGGVCKERAVHVPNGAVNDGLIDGLQALLAAYDKLCLPCGGFASCFLPFDSMAFIAFWSVCAVSFPVLM